MNTPAGRSGQDHGFAYRPALDGVRALAVTGVLLFHGGVTALSGGFLGVDAFFVLSGFLITSLLLIERESTGHIRLSRFWLRRARRLLPALLVLLATVVYAFRAILPQQELSLLRTDSLAALVYVANWRMIYRGDDYFTQTAAPSPLQHTWSLGIEEQFYLIWPLIVLGLLTIGLIHARRALLVICLAGAAASAVTAALLYDPANVTRAYFGTDARAQALLIGAALAACLAPRRASLGRSPTDTPRWVPRAAAVAGVAGIGVTGWLWSQTDGSQPLLYRGGFMVGSLAVAGVLAHAILSPAAAIARALSLAPVVWLGKISYGVYLWHWPLYQLINGERTGLTGPRLLALRLVATLAIAAASYLVIEQPIRTGRWPWPQRRLRMRPLVATTAAGTAVASVAAIIVVATAVPTGAAPDSVRYALPTIVPGSANSGPPVQRPGRRAGAQPRITFFGDSVSWSLGHYLPEQSGLKVTVRSIQGCGIARLPEIIQRGGGFSNYPGCTTWDARWRRDVNADDPDVAVILLDRWELMDRKLNGVYQHVGQPEYDAYLNTELELAISIAGSLGAHVVLLTAPYTRRAERPDGGLFQEDLPERVDAWNALLRAMAARYSDHVSVIDLNGRVCPDGKFTWSIGRLQIRSDGLHFTPSGVQQWIAPWLMPQLAAIAVGAPIPPSPTPT